MGCLRHDGGKAVTEQERAYYKALEALVESRHQAPPKLRYFLSPEAVAANIEPPKRAYADDAGFDIRLLSEKPVVIEPHQRMAIPTGLGFEIPSGWYGLVCNRTSGGRKGLIPLAQVVDASYTGYLNLTLHNTNNGENLILLPGERVAQIVFMPVWVLPLERIDPKDVKKTDRGTGAYGSSGRS